MTKKKVPLFEGNLTYWEKVCVWGLAGLHPQRPPKPPSLTAPTRSQSSLVVDTLSCWFSPKIAEQALLGLLLGKLRG